MQGFRRRAAKSKPAGIRSLVYGMSKTKVGIESLSVSRRFKGQDRGMGNLDQAEHECLFGRFLTIADRQCLVDPHSLVPSLLTPYKSP